MGRTLGLGLAVAFVAMLSGCGDDGSNPAAGTAATTSATGAGSGGSGSGGGGTGGGSGGSGTGGGATSCFSHMLVAPDYSATNPVIDAKCKGTNYQDITGVEKLVFLGDSITQGTPPTPSGEFYRTVLAEMLTMEFPGLEVVECAENGAKVDDLLGGGMQIPTCFPAPEPKKTLVVMTMGGNDIAEWAKDKIPPDQATASADVIAQTLREAIEWFDDPTRFPNGVYVIFANPYEFTDLTGDLDSCQLGSFAGFSGDYHDGVGPLFHLEEAYVQIAADTGRDVAFLFEEFCGHGFHSDDMRSPCYRGPDTPQWFDISCIHPTPEGHAQVAQMFYDIVTQ